MASLARRPVRGLAVSVVALVAVTAALTALFRSTARPPAADATLAPGVIGPRPAVAVLGFRNLSGRADAAWLSTALSEMLAAELGAGEKLRTIPGESVARMRADLSLADTDSLARDTLARVRNHLGAEFVVVGSYLALSKEAGGQIRLELRLQDAAAGETLATVSDTGSNTELIELVSRSGAQLRERLGAGDLPPGGAAVVKASLPGTLEAARLYAEGLERLRLSEALAARDLLESAVSADPSSPLAHVALAEALAALGYDSRAGKEARRAFELSGELSREERLLVEGRYREATREWEKAIEIYRALWRSFPDQVDYGLRLARAQTSAGNANGALATLEALRKVSAPARGDPRLDLAEAEAAESFGDLRRAQAAASRAAAKATALGARLLVARARVLEAYALEALGEPARAIAAGEEARRIFDEAGDRGGVARAVFRLAGVLWPQGDLVGARRLYEESLSISREIGDQKGVNLALGNLAGLLWDEGNLAEAKRLSHEALAISREIENKRAIASDLHRIGEVAYLQGDLAEASRSYEEALPMYREIDEKTNIADLFWGMGNVLFASGDVAGAKARYAEALALARKTGRKSFAAYDLFALGEVLLAEGDLAGAARKHQDALEILTSVGEKLDVAESQLALARLSLEEGSPGAAEAPARGAAEVFARERVADKEAGAYLVLARALLDQRRSVEARAAVDHASALSARVESPHIRLAVATAAARVVAEGNRAAEAVKLLRPALAEATKLGLVGAQLEARLALAEIETRFGDRVVGRAALAELERDAKARGFGLIARKARALAIIGP